MYNQMNDQIFQTSDFHNYQTTKYLNNFENEEQERIKYSIRNYQEEQEEQCENYENQYNICEQNCCQQQLNSNQQTYQQEPNQGENEIGRYFPNTNTVYYHESNIAKCYEQNPKDYPERMHGENNIIVEDDRVSERIDYQQSNNNYQSHLNFQNMNESREIEEEQTYNSSYRLINTNPQQPKNDEDVGSFHNIPPFSYSNIQCNNSDLFDSFCSIEESNDKQDSVVLSNSTKQRQKKQFNALQQQIHEDQQKELQEIQDRIYNLCVQYQPLFKDTFCKLNHHVKNNPLANVIVNQLREPLAQFYKKINISHDNQDVTQLKIDKQKQPEYQMQENHCMCSIHAKFTKLSSLRNHVSKHHNQMPTWIWQVKMSKNPGAPSKNIPFQENSNKRKNERYDKKIENLKKNQNSLKQSGKRQF